VLAGLALVAFAAFVLWPHPDRITWENFGRIHVGMDRAEVEAILDPPGDYRTGPAEYKLVAVIALGQSEWAYGRDAGPLPADIHWWRGDASIIRVSYDHAGQVVGLGQVDALEPKPGPLATLRWRVQRQWQKWFPR
jgi:hypothetical protein